jgi:uncharacterized protein YrrD
MNATGYDFKIGAPVLTDEDEVGRLKYVVVDSDAGMVTHLVVERGRLLRRDIVVPIGWVEHADAHGIRLNAKMAELDALPEYREVEFWAPDPTARPVAGHPPVNIRFWASPYSTIPTPRSTQVLHRVRLGMGEDEILVRRGLPVYTAEGDRVGTVDHLLMDPTTRRVTHLVIHRGFLLEEDRVVPVELVERATPEGIFLHLTSQEVARQPLYREERFASPPPDWEPLPGYSATDILFWGSPYGGVAPPVLPVVEHTIRHGIPERTIVLERSTEVRTRDDVTGEIDHLLVDPIRQELTRPMRRSRQPLPKPSCAREAMPSSMCRFRLTVAWCRCMAQPRPSPIKPKPSTSPGRYVGRSPSGMPCRRMQRSPHAFPLHWPKIPAPH